MSERIIQEFTRERRCRRAGLMMMLMMRLMRVRHHHRIKRAQQTTALLTTERPCTTDGQAQLLALHTHVVGWHTRSSQGRCPNCYQPCSCTRANEWLLWESWQGAPGGGNNPRVLFFPQTGHGGTYGSTSTYCTYGCTGFHLWVECVFLGRGGILPSASPCCCTVMLFPFPRWSLRFLP